MTRLGSTRPYGFELLFQVNTWDGGISVALFIPSPKHAPEIGEDAAAPNFYLKVRQKDVFNTVQ